MTNIFTHDKIILSLLINHTKDMKKTILTLSAALLPLITFANIAPTNVDMKYGFHHELPNCEATYNMKGIATFYDNQFDFMLNYETNVSGTCSYETNEIIRQIEINKMIDGFNSGFESSKQYVVINN